MPVQEVKYLQKNDIGTVIYMVVLDEDESPVNISTATLLEMKIKKPVTETVDIHTAEVHDGPNGIMKYTTVSGDLDEVGTFEAQGYVEMPGWIGHTDIQNFYVEDNLGPTYALHNVEAYMVGT